MMVLQRSGTIDAPPSAVWPVLVDVARWPQWNPTMRSVVPSESHLRAGVTAVIVQPKLPRAVWTVTEVVGGESFTWRMRSLGVVVDASHAVESVAGGSLVTLTLRFSGMFARPAFALSRRMNDRYIVMELAGLKAFVESRALREPQADTARPR